MSDRRSLVPVALALLLAGLSGAGCSRAGGVATVPVATGPAEPGTVPPSVEPAIDASPSLSPVEESPVGGSPVEESPATEPPMAEPPAASIAVEGGDPIVGQLGTFTWENGGSDAPWLDGSPIHVGAGERLTLTLAQPVEIADWGVSRAPPGTRDGTGAVLLDQGSGEPVRFLAPPAGTWSVEVSVRFAGDRGTALYFWLIEVG